MTTMLGASAGSAAASWRNSAAHVGRTVPPSNSSRPGMSDSSTAAANAARSAAGSAPWLAWKNTNGRPARSQNTSTSRDLPTRRRPRSSTATPGRSRRASPTRLSSASSRASSAARPTNPSLAISLLAPELQSTVVHHDGVTFRALDLGLQAVPRRPSRHSAPTRRPISSMGRITAVGSSLIRPGVRSSSLRAQKMESRCPSGDRQDQSLDRLP